MLGTYNWHTHGRKCRGNGHGRSKDKSSGLHIIDIVILGVVVTIRTTVKREYVKQCVSKIIASYPDSVSPPRWTFRRDVCLSRNVTDGQHQLDMVLCFKNNTNKPTLFLIFLNQSINRIWHRIKVLHQRKLSSFRNQQTTFYVPLQIHMAFYSNPLWFPIPRMISSSLLGSQMTKLSNAALVPCLSISIWKLKMIKMCAERSSILFQQVFWVSVNRFCLYHRGWNTIL